MPGFGSATTETLLITRGRLLLGLDKVAAHIDAGTFGIIEHGRQSPPSEAGQLTRILLEEVDAELARREETK
jgi:hypothetical protein